MTFLPPFLLAIISTLDLTNKKSLSIVISHPYLVLLPTFNMISYSKQKICGDRRISFSPKLSWVNMLLNAVVLPGIFFIFDTIRLFFDASFTLFFFLLFPSLLFTLLFLYLEKISCCSCCGSAGRLVRVFDPEHPEKSLVLKEGRVVEVTDLDVEQGGDVEMTGLEEETEETVANNTVDIADRRASEEADDELDLETEEYRLEEEEKMKKKEMEKGEEEEEKKKGGVHRMISDYFLETE